MLDIRIYGHLRKKFDAKARLSGDLILTIPAISNEDFKNLLNRLEVNKEEVGDCFVNGKIASDDDLIPDYTRVALFSSGMYLIDGGQHIKGHGYITKSPPKLIDYYF